MAEPASFFNPTPAPTQQPGNGDGGTGGGAPSDPIHAAISGALEKMFPAGEGGGAQNFAALRSARAEEFAKHIPAEAKELLELRAKVQEFGPKMERFPALEELYAKVAYKETPEFRSTFVTPLEKARQDLTDLANDYGISQDALRALESMSPKDRRAKLEKDYSPSLASDLERSFRETARASKALADEEARLGKDSKPVADLLRAVNQHFSSSGDPAKHLEGAIAALSAQMNGAPVDPFFGSREGQEVAASLKGKPISTKPEDVASMALKAAGYERIVSEYAKLYAENQRLRGDTQRFRTAQPSGGTSQTITPGSGDNYTPQPRKGSFG